MSGDVYDVGDQVWTFSSWFSQDAKDVPAEIVEVVPGGLYGLACDTKYYSLGLVYRTSSEMCRGDEAVES
jgi:hypothetical protein